MPFRCFTFPWYVCHVSMPVQCWGSMYLEWLSQPECRLFSRARGRPVHLPDGRTIPGPQAVRDAKHVMGFPWVPNQMKIDLRRSNAMALRGLKRMQGTFGQRRYVSLEHPYRSWLWYFGILNELTDGEFALPMAAIAAGVATGKSGMVSWPICQRCCGSFTCPSALGMGTSGAMKPASTRTRLMPEASKGNWSLGLPAASWTGDAGRFKQSWASPLRA